MVLKEFDDFRYAGTVDNFQFFGKGQPFAFQNGQPLTVTEDTYVLIPMKPEERGFARRSAISAESVAAAMKGCDRISDWELARG